MRVNIDSLLPGRIMHLPLMHDLAKGQTARVISEEKCISSFCHESVITLLFESILEAEQLCMLLHGNEKYPTL